VRILHIYKIVDFSFISLKDLKGNATWRVALHEVSRYVSNGFSVLIAYYHSAIWDMCFWLHFTAIRVHLSLNLKLSSFN
jgi:hypothetical protein